MRGPAISAEEIEATVRGEPDPTSGYLIDMKDLKAVLNRTVVDDVDVEAVHRGVVAPAAQEHAHLVTVGHQAADEVGAEVTGRAGDEDLRADRRDALYADGLRAAWAKKYLS